jgi:restriction endonuclease BamHI
VRLVHTEVLIASGAFARSAERRRVVLEIKDAISRVVWPPGSRRFVIRKELEANGVTPIKSACMTCLNKEYGWMLEPRLAIGDGMGAGKIDAVRETKFGLFALEWETGNISSSHRSVNKMALGLIQKRIAGGAIILPTRDMYNYLTDRVGNYRELAPYFPLWKHVVGADGVLLAFAVEHDAADPKVPAIKKGTDGRALR